MTYELLGVAGKLAAQSDRAVAAVLIGHDVERHVPELAAHGADLVFTADHPSLAQYATLPYTRVLADAVAGKRPYALLLPATVNGRDLAARLAARLGLGLTGDCIDLDINKRRSAGAVQAGFWRQHRFAHPVTHDAADGDRAARHAGPRDAGRFANGGDGRA